MQEFFLPVSFFPFFLSSTKICIKSLLTCAIKRSGLRKIYTDCAFRWIQQLDGLYPLQYIFWTWHYEHALVNVVYIPSHVSKVQHM
jgi:hypothetical protein